MATITSPRPQSPASSARTPQLPQSPSLTPASSARASLDLPGARAASPAAAVVNPTQRRNRAALRDYYNLKAKTAPSIPGSGTAAAGTGGTGTGTPSQALALSRTTSTASSSTTNTTTTTQDPSSNPLPADIDTVTFAPTTYVSSLLSTSNLKTILRTEATLISEIRTLDGERKALVYDNYSKLIEATATIGAMQRGMADGVGFAGSASGRKLGDAFGTEKGNGMEMEKLAPALERVVMLASGLGWGQGQGQGYEFQRANESETSKEEKLTYLQEQQQLLLRQRKKQEAVRWVIGAPARFEMYADSGRREDLEREWKEVELALTKWEGVKGAAEIQSKCRQIMDRVNENEAG